MRIEQYLLNTGISATKFAALAGVPTSTITRIMTGDVFQARFSTQKKIVTASEGSISFEDLYPKIRVEK